MDYNYLVPANSKKQGLIFGIFKPLDLIILLAGILVSFICCILLPLNKLWGVIVAITPAFVAGFLVFPIFNYHNTRVFFHEMYKFYFVNRRKYVWRGWCYQYEQSDEQYDEQSN